MALSSTSTTSQDLYSKWTAIRDEDLQLDDIHGFLNPVADDLWVAAACVDRLLEDVDLERSLLELGLKRTEAASLRCRKMYNAPLSEIGDEMASSSTRSEEYKRSAALVSYFRDEPADAQLCHLRTVFLDRLDRLNAFVQIMAEMPEEDIGEDDDEEWEDDPWAGDKPPSTKKKVPPPIPLSVFLVDGLVSSACFFSSMENFAAVGIILERFSSAVWPYRFMILENIPEHTPASEYRHLLPVIDFTRQCEQKPGHSPHRNSLCWSEILELHEVVIQSQISPKPDHPADEPYPESFPQALSLAALSAWYRGRVEIIVSSGFVDAALSLVQHAASQGVANLDEVGEELSLLARLVYDLPHSVDIEEEGWTLCQWKSLAPYEVIKAYLKQSSAETIVRDIHRLVMPYLFVLESRAERSGSPDPSLPNCLLYRYILEAPLQIILAVFEGSKPTLPPTQRLLRDNEDMARLALACLYGSDRLDEWPTMSRIFECLPAWETTEDVDNADEVATTISSLGDFVTPSTVLSTCTPSDLLLFFQPLPFSSLSQALDVLDIHLESGEILARWGVPAPLRWFLQSNSNISEQRSWANRMARRAGGTKEKMSSQDDWEWLLDDMLKLAGSGNVELRGAFCLLSKDDIARIFFGGLLGAAQFDIAKELLHSRQATLQLSPDVVEELCLCSSQEFYDNASSGNYHYGGMKLAYDCLAVASPSERIQRQKYFIEATSRLCSYRLTSRPGIPISPIEIRLTKDRLSLISRVLSSNNDAYKHTQVLLELVDMLGFKGDTVAEVKTLAMLSDTALQAEDFERAYETSERLVSRVLGFRSSSTYVPEDPSIQEASEVCWVACYQLGRQQEFADIPKKLYLLGRALELCPPDQLVDVVAARRRLEQEDLEERKTRLNVRRTQGIRNFGSRQRAAHGNGNTSSLATRLQELRMPNLRLASSPMTHAPDPTALAEKAFRVAANFSFSDFSARGRSLIADATRDTSSSTSKEGSWSNNDPGTEVSAQAQRVLSKGLGWLLGDEE